MKAEDFWDVSTFLPSFWIIILLFSFERCDSVCPVHERSESHVFVWNITYWWSSEWQILHNLWFHLNTCRTTSEFTVLTLEHYFSSIVLKNCSFNSDGVWWTQNIISIIIIIIISFLTSKCLEDSGMILFIYFYFILLIVFDNLYFHEAYSYTIQKG